MLSSELMVTRHALTSLNCGLDKVKTKSKSIIKWNQSQRRFISKAGEDEFTKTNKEMSPNRLQKFRIKSFNGLIL